LADSLAAGLNVSGTADTKSCALCRSVAEARLGDAAAVHNRKLLETPQFIVLPSVGPLVVGHVMVVSKAHSASLASMGKDAIDEYESIAVRLKRAPLLRDGDPLEAEHGSTENNKAGACVIHTHVHWIPNMGPFWTAFEQRLRRRSEGCLLEVGAQGGPYIFARAAGGRGIFEAHGLRSQTIRGILCSLMEREDTDWTQALRMNWVEETVKAWLHDGQRF
jgi:diadenosine tetraphosphate (Ap4A) HIT family hydrolase